MFGLLAAALFGLSAPMAKRLLAGASPQMLAGLLYLGAAAGIAVYRRLRPDKTEAPLVRKDVPPLVVVVVAGGILGPVLMLLGLQRTTAVTGSLLLNLEAVFTIALAALLFGEHLGARVVGSMALILVGAGILKFQPGTPGAAPWGVVLLASACLCWAIDNNLTQRLSSRDPFLIAQVKTLGAGAFNIVFALLLMDDRWPSARITVVALGIGTISYGASLVLDGYALRYVGAAREAAFFATAPFIGALASTVIVGERIDWIDAVSMTAMAAGIALLLRERHGHGHGHQATAHTHAHTHDLHHQHAHDPQDPAGEPHAHLHRHAPLVHDHPHVPDLHHRHKH